MPQNPKKMAVLNLLRQQHRSLSLAQLMQQLDKGYAQRTVRRWLAEMTEAGLVSKTGQKRSTRYQAILETPFSDISQHIIQQIKQPIFNRSPASYNTTWLDDYQPNKTRYFSEKLISELHSVGNSGMEQQPAGTYARHIYNRLLIDLSYNSSRLEGNTYSLLETQQLIIEGKKGENKLNEETIMILNHKEAIRYLIDNASKIQINENSIGTLHYLLSDALVPTKFSGKVRDHSVRITGSVYIPMENPKLLKRQLHLICLKTSLIKEPFESSLFLLTHLSYLQAFIDVNKRTSRLSANIPLIQNNLIPLSFNDVQQEDYINAMIAIYELNTIQPLIDIYIQSYLQTCEFYRTTSDMLGFDEIRVRYRQQRRDIIRHIIIEQLHDEAMKNYIQQKSRTIGKTNEIKQFIEDIYEDLEQINKSRIAGLGITKDQLLRWKKK